MLVRKHARSSGRLRHVKFLHHALGTDFEVKVKKTDGHCRSTLLPSLRSRVSTALAAGSNTSSQRPSPLKARKLEGFTLRHSKLSIAIL